MKMNIRQQNIPGNWKQVKLRELTLKIGSGVTPKGGSEIYLNHGIKFLRSQNIQNGYLDLSDIVYISSAVDDRMKSSRVYKNDVLYNITGASIGRSAVYLLDETANVNQHVCILRLNNANPKFISALLLSREGINQLYSFQAGGNRQGLNYQQLGSFSFTIPPINEQNRIVAVLETWDKAIEVLEKKIEIKKKIKRGLMQQLLTGEIRVYGFNDVWYERKLSDIGTFSKGAGILKDQLSKEGINAIRYGELYTRYNFQINNIYSFISKTVADTSKKISYGDILFAGSGETIDEIGKSAAYLLNEECYAGGDIIIFTPKDQDSLFLSYFLNTGEARKKLRELGQGQSVVHIYKSDLENLILRIPSFEEQKAISNIINGADSEIFYLEKKLQVIRRQKKYLLNNLITGTIRTPENLKIN